MNTAETIEALSALAHEHRLAVYRLLVERGPVGLSAGDIAERVGLPPSSLTFHVQALQRAHLVTRRRSGRQLFYAADFTAVNNLVGYLTKNCCGQTSSECYTPVCSPKAERRPKKSRRAA